MDNLNLKEEMQILAAARLAGTDAPEELAGQRARQFVHRQLKKEKSGRWAVLKSPVTYVAFAVAACAAIVLTVVNSNAGSSLDVMQQDQVHAAADSVDIDRDSLKTAAPETFEIAVIDE